MQVAEISTKPSGALTPRVLPATPGVVMLRLCSIIQRAAVRAPRPIAWLLPLQHIIALVALLMLPVPMHTGAELPHQDAMVALILDANDGIIDHHIGVYLHEPRVGASLEQHGETPAFGNALHAQGGGGIIALVILAMPLLLLPDGKRTPCWPRQHPGWGNIPSLEPPPPRFAA